MQSWRDKCIFCLLLSAKHAYFHVRLLLLQFPLRMSLRPQCTGAHIELVSNIPLQKYCWLTWIFEALRRHGSWRRDLNVELINPFTRNIAHSWSKVFEADLFGPFEAAVTSSINKLLKDVEESAALGLKDRTKIQGEECLEEVRVALKKTMDLVKETMNNQQKEVSRCMAPHVQSQLVEGYDRAMEERGTGSVARQKVNIFFAQVNCIWRTVSSRFRPLSRRSLIRPRTRSLKTVLMSSWTGWPRLRMPLGRPLTRP